MNVSAAADPTADGAPPNTILRARRELAAAIRRGDYRPNQRLIESDLTVALGVSRPTLRSVFVALEQENYISLERNRGARVRQFSVDEAIEILQTREILESAAAGLAAERAEPAECELLDSVVESMIEADRAGDGRRYQQFNRQFHDLLLSAARQSTLCRFIAATPYPLVMSQYRDAAAANHPREGSLREHQAILAAVRAGNRIAAEAAMVQHLAAARQALAIGAASA